MRERLDSQREGPNLCFCWQAQYFQGFADFAEEPKIDKNRRKIAPMMLREHAARRKLDVSVPGRDLASIFVASACSRRSRALFLASWGVLGDPPDTPGARRGRSGTLPRHSRDALGTHLDASGCPKGYLERFCIDFGCPEASPGIDFRLISAMIFDSFCERVGQRTA